MNQHTNPWTDADKETVLSMLLAGKSVSEIRAALPDRTRGALSNRIDVLRKSGAVPPVGRLPRTVPISDEVKALAERRYCIDGWGMEAIAKELKIGRDHLIRSIKAWGWKKPESVVRVVKIQEARVRQPREEASLTERANAFKPIPFSEPRIWTERPKGGCKWPVGGEGADMLMCCRPAAGATYCGIHQAIAYRAPAPQPIARLAVPSAIRRRAA